MNQASMVCEVHFERLHVGHVAGQEVPVYGVGRITRPAGADAPKGQDAWVIAPASSNTSTIQWVDCDSCIPLPLGLTPDRALLVPRLALVLWAWDVAALELGESAIVTSGSMDARVFAQVGAWRAGRQMVYLDLGDGPEHVPGHSTSVNADDPQMAIERLVAMTREAPGVAAVVLSSKAKALDVLLEAMPTWGRMMVAVVSTEAVAIDFYNNVHRKGVRIMGFPASAMCMFDSTQRYATSVHVLRAMRIMQNDVLAASCFQQTA